MKIRNGFVSNSSSSSFIIPLIELSNDEIETIKNHINIAKKHTDYYSFGWVDDGDKWSIRIDENYLSGYTNMDNFDMYEFIHKYMKIPKEIVKWDYS